MSGDYVPKVGDRVPIPTFRERWMNAYDVGFVSWGYPSRDEADEQAARNARVLGRRRIGVIHLHPDGRVEMEQP